MQKHDKEMQTLWEEKGGINTKPESRLEATLGLLL